MKVMVYDARNLPLVKMRSTIAFDKTKAKYYTIAITI